MNQPFSELPVWKRSAILFWAFFKITSLVIGGGYAIIAAAQEEFVSRRKWLSEDDVIEMITITQTVPGILACNSAIYIGWRVAGFTGAVAGLLGSAVPSVIIIVCIAAGMRSIEHFVETPLVQGAFKGIIGCIVGMVVVTALKMRKKAVKGVYAWCVAMGCFIGMTVFGLKPGVLIIGAIVAGLAKVIFDSLLHRQKKESAQ